MQSNYIAGNPSPPLERKVFFFNLCKCLSQFFRQSGGQIDATLMSDELKDADYTRQARARVTIIKGVKTLNTLLLSSSQS